MRRILLLMLAAAWPAAAHVTIDPPEAPANSFTRIALRVPHGCAGNATIAIEVSLPEGVTMARPQPRSGWQIAIETRPLVRPQASDHGLVRQSPAAIAWRGGPLPDAHYEEFVLLIRTPDRAGETLLFPVVQLCENNTRHDWVEQPATPRPRQPAATLRLSAR